MKMIDSIAAAKAIEAHPTTVVRLAKAYSLGQQIGRTWIFTAGDVARLRRVKNDGPGNPDMQTDAAKIGRKGGLAKAAKPKRKRKARR